MSQMVFHFIPVTMHPHIYGCPNNWNLKVLKSVHADERKKRQMTVHNDSDMQNKKQRLYDDFRLLCYLVRDCMTTQ